MSYFHLFFFFLLYELLLHNYCDANYFFNRYTKEVGRTVPKHSVMEKDESPQYIDEVVEIPSDMLPSFENLRLHEDATRKKPGQFYQKKIFKQGLA